MIDLIEVFDRAEIGPLTSETDYYMKRYVPKLAEVIARLGLPEWESLLQDRLDTELGFEASDAAADEEDDA